MQLNPNFIEDHFIFASFKNVFRDDKVNNFLRLDSYISDLNIWWYLEPYLNNTMRAFGLESLEIHLNNYHCV